MSGMFSVPLLIIRTDADALIEVNGQQYGECRAFGQVAVPVSDEGECYVLVMPLVNGGTSRFYSVTRKLSFRDGEPLPPVSDDVTVLKWDDAIYEVMIKVGRFPKEDTGAPKVIASLKAPYGTGDIYTLYVENGLKFAVENGSRVLAGYSLGYGTDGSISFFDTGDRLLTVISAKLEERERMLILDSALSPMLDVTGDAVYIEDGTVRVIKRLNTLMLHEMCTEYNYENGRFTAKKPIRGYYTHKKPSFTGNYETARAFCEAVREEFAEEAVSYLTEELKKGVGFSELREFVGSFTDARVPVFAGSENMLGLISSADGMATVRLLKFDFSDGLISNITEC